MKTQSLLERVSPTAINLKRILVPVDFGEASEAAQLLETELGTVLLFFGAVDDGLITPTLQTSQVDSKRAADLLRRGYGTAGSRASVVLRIKSDHSNFR